MAERLKHQLLEKEKIVDIVAGPDSYKDLPRLLTLTDSNQTAVNVLLSLDETYADIVPVRLNQDAVTAFVYVKQAVYPINIIFIILYSRKFNGISEFLSNCSRSVMFVRIAVSLYRAMAIM